MRRLLVLGLVAALATVFLVPTASANGNMVHVCHATGNGSHHLIRISEKAVAKHIQNHGDGLPGAAVPGMPGYEFDATCQSVLVPIPESGSIVIAKATFPVGGTGFGFTDDIEAPNSFSLDDGQTRTFTNVLPGLYAVSETVPAGWDLTSTSCDDGSPPTAIDLSAGETVTCTFENTQRGSVTIVKDTVPDDPQSFLFTGDLGAFSLVDNGGANSTTFTSLVPGAYDVTESDPSPAVLSDISCDDGASATPSTAAGTTATINLDPGEGVTCSFTNSLLNPGIDIEKTTNENQADGADDPDVPILAPGEQLTWTYEVTNTGDVAFAGESVVVTDDVLGVIAGPGSGDVNNNNALDPGETWVYTASGFADTLTSTTPNTVPGCGTDRPTYENVGTVDAGSASDSDPSHYCNPAIEVDLQIEMIAIPEEVIAGTDFVYTLRVTNLGPDPATGVVVLDALPARTLGVDAALFAPAAGFEQFPFFDENSDDVGDPFFRINNPPTILDPVPLSSDERLATNGVAYNGFRASRLGVTCDAERAAAHALRCEIGNLGAGELVEIALDVTMDTSAFFRVWNRAWVYGNETLSGNEPNQTKADAGELCQTTSNTDIPPFDPAAPGGPTLMGTGCNYVKKNATVLD